MTLSHIITQTLSIVSASTLIIGGLVLNPINTHAQSIPGNGYKVDAIEGLNIRNNNCERVNTIAHGTLVNVDISDWDTMQTTNTTCNINGRTYDMVKISFYQGGPDYENTKSTSDVYAARDFLKQIKTNVYFEVFGYQIGASKGLNIRDKNCQKIGSLPYQQEITYGIYAIMNSFNCQVNGVQYAMSPYENGYIATAFLAEGEKVSFPNDFPGVSFEEAQYTNQYFPELEINYNNSWTYSTTTTPTKYKNLLSRKVVLTKGDTQIQFNIDTIVIAGCGGLIDANNLPINATLSNGNNTTIYRYEIKQGQVIYARSKLNTECYLGEYFEQKTNIASSKETEPIARDGKVRYAMTIQVTGTEHLAEADQIIINSKFQQESLNKLTLSNQFIDIQNNSINKKYGW